MANRVNQKKDQIDHLIVETKSSDDVKELAKKFKEIQDQGSDPSSLIGEVYGLLNSLSLDESQQDKLLETYNMLGNVSSKMLYVSEGVYILEKHTPDATGEVFTH